MENIDLKQINTFIFDFDSTIVSIETLDTIIKSKLDDEDVKNKIDDITKQSMNGELDFNKSLLSRITAADLNADDFKEMAGKICDYIIPDIKKAIDFLNENNQKIFIISGGFMEIIKPVADKLGIPFENCFANDIKVDNDDNVIGVLDQPLAYDKGKSNIIKQLRQHSAIIGKTIMIGDGMSDYEVFENKQADVFIGCGFVVSRPNVVNKAPYFVNDPIELIDLFK